MRPLPRVLAFADDRIAALEDIGVRAAAIAAAGSGVALVARQPHGTADQLARLAERFVSLTRPPMAVTLVTGRIDVALAAGAGGVILRRDDLPVHTAREVAARAAGFHRDGAGPLVLRSVHSEAEAAAAAGEGADALIAGPIWPTATHTGTPAGGTGFLARVVSLGVPTYAIGGVTPARAGEVRQTGAWGVAAIGALWDAPQPHRATTELLAALQGES